MGVFIFFPRLARSPAEEPPLVLSLEFRGGRLGTPLRAALGGSSRSWLAVRRPRDDLRSRPLAYVRPLPGPRCSSLPFSRSELQLRPPLAPRALLAGLLLPRELLLALLFPPLAPRELRALLLSPNVLAWLLCPRELSPPALRVLLCAVKLGKTKGGGDFSRTRSRLMVLLGRSLFVLPFAKLNRGGTGDERRSTLFVRWKEGLILADFFCL